MPLFWALSHAGNAVYLGVLIALMLASIPVAARAGRAWQQPDDPRIVIDEAVGIGIACFTLVSHQYGWFLAAFIAFRITDIFKPWPASYFDRRQKNGFGTIMDDVVAGLYALIAVQLAKFLLTDGL